MDPPEGSRRENHFSKSSRNKTSIHSVHLTDISTGQIAGKRDGALKDVSHTLHLTNVPSGHIAVERACSAKHARHVSYLTIKHSIQLDKSLSNELAPSNIPAMFRP